MAIKGSAQASGEHKVHRRNDGKDVNDQADASASAAGTKRSRSDSPSHTTTTQLKDSHHGASDPESTGGNAVNVLEQGNIYFLYRPKVQRTEGSKSIDDVQRLYMILVPADRHIFRCIVIGRKRLPDVESHQAFWAFCEVIGNRKDMESHLREESYDTATRGKRILPGARPAAEGKYRLVDRANGRVYLDYELNLPEDLGPVQDEFNIEKAASYVMNIKNPEAGQPSWAGLQPEQKAMYPKGMMQKFHGGRYARAEPIFLDYQGCELMMIGARGEEGESQDLKQMIPEAHRTGGAAAGTSANKGDGHSADDARKAEMFKDLPELRDEEEHPREPLQTGEWA